MDRSVSLGFDPHGILVPLANLLPLKQLSAAFKLSEKYQQILASVREVGIIEPLNVFPQKGTPGKYLLLDGHIRLAILKQIGESHARCLVATDDEAFTYNRHVNRMAPIQENHMIVRAIKSGVSEERIAKVLNLKVARIHQKRDLLDGICREAAEILKNRQMSEKAFAVLKKMKPMRQIEAAELMIASSNCSVPYLKAILVATPQDMLVDTQKARLSEGLTPVQVAKMEKEMEVLQRELKHVEETHGNDVLNLVLACGYLAKLFSNARVAGYLDRHHPDIFRELKAVSETSLSETGS